MSSTVFLLAASFKYCFVKVFSIGEGYCLIRLHPKISLSDPQAVDPTYINYLFLDINKFVPFTALHNSAVKALIAATWPTH
jgi:hypothetical protein